MLLHAATAAARAIDEAPPRRAAVFPSIPVAPPPVAPLHSPLYLPPSPAPSARYPSNSWASFVPSAVARLYPVPTASSILTLGRHLVGCLGKGAGSQQLPKRDDPRC
ncbi:EF-hand domain-containing protein [Pseudoscourfieldia marina]